MAIFNAGALPALVIMVVTFCCLLFFMITKGRKGKEMKLRKLPAISAIEEAVGAATERGRPVHYTTDTIGLAHADGAQCYAGLSIMAYTADLAAQRDCRMIVSILPAEEVPVVDDILTQAYTKAGRPEGYRRDYSLRFFSGDTFAFAAGVAGTLEREQCAANIFIGGLMGSSLMHAEVGNRVGAINIAGTAYTHQMPFLVVACDYSLIGEEIFAGAAYASKNPLQISSIVGQDVAKAIVMGLIVVSVVLVNFGIKTLNDLLLTGGI